jgi:hypothetical protein
MVKPIASLFAKSARLSLAGLFSLMFFCGPAVEKHARAQVPAPVPVPPKFVASLQYYNAPNTNPKWITPKSDTITLFWNAVDNGIDSVRSYELFYLPYPLPADSAWKYLKTVAASPKPTVTVYRNEINLTTPFFFGVRCVTKENVRSDIHSSLDSTANLHQGWYIKWNQ